MKLPIFQVGAFTDKVFGGNPAAVCPLEHWLPDDIMLKIAIENSVAETAFSFLCMMGLKFVGSPQKLNWICADTQHLPPQASIFEDPVTQARFTVR